MRSQCPQSVTGTILVADDQASNRELLQELLTPHGFEVITAADGMFALEQLNRTKVDVDKSPLPSSPSSGDVSAILTRHRSENCLESI
jgi:CheY-like chemotaxis protein